MDGISPVNVFPQLLAGHNDGSRYLDAKYHSERQLNVQVLLPSYIIFGGRHILYNCCRHCAGAVFRVVELVRFAMPQSMLKGYRVEHGQVRPELVRT